MKALILGHKGMLGHMVFKYFKSKKVKCSYIDYRWPSNDFFNSIKCYRGDFIINCIGAIPQKTRNFQVNFLLPLKLESISNCKIIHPGTDCEMDDSSYGWSKMKASNIIKMDCKRTKIIKTSIIGPELNSNKGLLEWFLSESRSVDGYSEFYWNGNTTLTWAKCCFLMMNFWDDYKIEIILQSDPISKYELLLILKEIYNKDINIIRKDTPKVNKCLTGGRIMHGIKEQLYMMIEFYNK